jgi:hypothetical protein
LPRDWAEMNGEGHLHSPEPELGHGVQGPEAGPACRHGAELDCRARALQLDPHLNINKNKVLASL